jgi:hypothetical protein
MCLLLSHSLIETCLHGSGHKVLGSRRSLALVCEHFSFPRCVMVANLLLVRASHNANQYWRNGETDLTHNLRRTMVIILLWHITEEFFKVYIYQTSCNSEDPSWKSIYHTCFEWKESNKKTTCRNVGRVKETNKGWWGTQRIATARNYCHL